jgi:hypothetical protein
MALQSFQLDPAGGVGVSQAEFDSHTHAYRKITRVGADDDDKFGSPSWETIVDNADTVAFSIVDMEAVGITVATEQTGTPI